VGLCFALKGFAVLLDDATCDFFLNLLIWDMWRVMLGHATHDFYACPFDQVAMQQQYDQLAATVDAKV
jgi:hypothetical protein